MTLVKQSNGNYSVWSGIVDDFTFINITKDEYIEMKKEELEKELEEGFKKIDEFINYGIVYTLGERLEIIEKVHGKERRKEVEKLLSKR